MVEKIKNVNFRIDARIALVIGSSIYDRFRLIQGREGTQDLPETLEDIKVVCAGLRRLKFKRHQIRVLVDPDWSDLSITIREITLQVIKNYKNFGTQTLIFVYYEGHGAMDQYTKCVLNGERMYPLEQTLRTLARQDGTYVIAVFDCCREVMDVGQTRGINASNDVDIDECEDENTFVSKEKADSFKNFIVTFGCEPSRGVAQKSTIARGYFRFLRMMADVVDGHGKLQMPGCLQLYNGSDKKCETLSRVEQLVTLEWQDKGEKDGIIDQFSTQANFF